MDYNSFIDSKKITHKSNGIDVNDSDLNPILKRFQKYAVKKALKNGRYALFEECGLGKTFQQIEWARIVYEKTNKSVIIFAPLAVSFQTIEEGKKLNVDIRHLRNNKHENHGIYIVNYEQIENIDTSLFIGVVLDESSIIKNFSGKLRNLIIDKFQNTPFKLACTATPAPNDHMELGNHSEFLNIMSRTEMLSMFFVHDGGETQKWRLKNMPYLIFGLGYHHGRS